MKKIRMGLMALAALTGIGGAFAFSPKKNLTTYYAQKTTGAHFHWVTSRPATDCLADPNVAVACTIMTNTVPIDDQLPAGHIATHQAFQAD